MSATRRRIYRPKIAEFAASLALVLAVASCGGSPRVSLWGESEAPNLGAYITPPDLDAQLAAVDAETASNRLELVTELRGQLPRGGGELVVRGYAGIDVVGRPVSAVRVATPRGVVMALGPARANDDHRGATELVPALLAGPEGNLARSAFQSGTDLNGDEAPDVVARHPASGELEVWSVTALGASRLSVVMEVAPVAGDDVDGDGWPDLVGRVGVAPGDAIGPDLVDVATFAGGVYSNANAGAREFHARAAARLSPPRKGARSESEGEGPERGRGGEGARAQGEGAGRGGEGGAREDDVARLRRVIERAWHATLAGGDAARIRSELDREAVPQRLREAFDVHRARVRAIGARR